MFALAGVKVATGGVHDQSKARAIIGKVRKAFLNKGLNIGLIGGSVWAGANVGVLAGCLKLDRGA